MLRRLRAFGALEVLGVKLLLRGGRWHVYPGKVRKVTSGTRFASGSGVTSRAPTLLFRDAQVLAMWFTLSAAHQRRD